MTTAYSKQHTVIIYTNNTYMYVYKKNNEVLQQ